MNSIGVVLVVYFLNFTFASAAVKISEVAWMGTEASPNAEWIELFNDSDTAVNLAGWKLYETNNTLVFTFSRTIEPNSYLILERITNTVSDPLPLVDDEAGSFGGGGLSNVGEDLILKDNEGTTIDSLLFHDGWPAGKSGTRETMQLGGSEWKTASPTPKAGMSTPPKNDNNNEGNDHPKVLPRAPARPKEEEFLPKEPKVILSHPEFFVAGVAGTIKAVVEIPRGTTHIGHFVWNTGDGYGEEKKELVPFSYIYEYPGNYIFTLAYFDEKNSVEPLAIARFEAKVIAPSITTTLLNQTTFQITNKTKETIVLDGWSVQENIHSFSFPRYTSIAPNESIKIPAKRLGLIVFGDTPILKNPRGEVLGAINTSAVHTSSVIASSRKETPTKVEENNTEILGATAINAFDEAPKNKERTWLLLSFGALIVISIGLVLLLERFTAQKE